MAYAICSPQNAEQAAASLSEEVERLRSETIPGEELAEGKQSYAKMIENRWANDRTVAMALTESLALDRSLLFFEGLYQAIQDLSADQIEQALRDLFRTDSLVWIKAGDLESSADGS